MMRGAPLQGWRLFTCVVFWFEVCGVSLGCGFPASSSLCQLRCSQALSSCGVTCQSPCQDSAADTTQSSTPLPSQKFPSLHSLVRCGRCCTCLSSPRGNVPSVLNKAFQGKSRSLGFFEQRLSEANRHLDYIAPMQFHPWKLTPWQAAKLVQAHAEGKRVKATRTRTAMRWLQHISGAEFHQYQQLVRDQVQGSVIGEWARQKHAAPPRESAVMWFEEQVTSAPTAPLRCHGRHGVVPLPRNPPRAALAASTMQRTARGCSVQVR